MTEMRSILLDMVKKIFLYRSVGIGFIGINTRYPKSGIYEKVINNLQKL